MKNEPNHPNIHAADLFCGAGGTSSGLMDAAGDLGLTVDLVAVNHWDVAIATHTANHPGAHHHCASVDSLNPRHLVPGGRLELLVASPECIHFSSARGGKPMSDQSRASAWCILRWCEALDVRNVLIENVPDFRGWGPLYDCTCGAEDAIRAAVTDSTELPLAMSKVKHLAGFPCRRPIPEKKGDYYRLFFYNLRKLGYSVGDAILCAADYGDATTRKRLFIQARKLRSDGKRRRLTWPKPSHSKLKRASFQPGVLPWRAAREIIDWELEGQSIYTRANPLAENTLRRIFAGVRKFSGLPFILPHLHGSADQHGGRRSGWGPRGIEEPLPTITGSSSSVSLCEPFLVVLRNHADGRSLDEPAPALCAGGQHLGLAEPFLFTMEHSGSEDACRTYPLDHPMPAITTADGWCMAEPFLVAYRGDHAGEQDGDARTYSVEEPLRTLDTSNRYAVAEPFLVPNFTEREGQAPRVHSIEEPLPTVTGHGAGCLAQPFLIRYNGSEHDGHSVEEPLGTVDCRDRFALVAPELVASGEVAGEVVGYLDIRFRMLQPHELAGAHSFEKDYIFTGNREQQVKQIGNSVPRRLAAALCRELLGG